MGMFFASLCVVYFSWPLACNADTSTGDMQSTRVAAVPGPTKSGNSLPDQLDLSFSMGADRVNLTLTLNDHVTSDAPVYVAVDGEVLQYTNHTQNDFAMYTDMSKEAGFLVGTHEQEGKQMKSYRGSFRVGKDEYVLEPRPESQSRRRRSTDLDDLDYVVYKREPQPEEMEFEADSVTRPEMTNDNLHMDEYVGSSGYYPGRQVYTVEMFLFIDYAIFNRWVQRSRKYYYESRKRDAIDNIRYYFSQIINGIGMRYQSINEPDYAIYVRLNGFYIATTPDDSPWTHRSPNIEYGRTRHYTPAARALDAFEHWLNVSADKLPAFDQATLYTGNILYHGLRSDRSRRTISGLADIKGVCSYFKASINIDAGVYAGIQTGAHELGHSLGAEHDSSVNNWCLSRDQYVMAVSPGELTDRNAKNPFTFSPCSRAAFRRFLFYLSLKGKNCLLVSSGNWDVRVRSARDDLPGRRYDLDEQCKIRNGFASYYCGGHPNDLNICKRVMCFIPEQNKCTDPVEQKAYDGTTCGDRKWCEAGKCVYRSVAPSAKDFCLSGDFKGRLMENGRTCKQTISREPWQCYDTPYKYQEHCCDTCRQLQDDSKPGCEFGDHSYTGCRDVKSQPWKCYDRHVKQRCCGTCAEIAETKKNSVPENCEYGDRQSSCSRLERVRCYLEHKVCCEKCTKIATKNEECPWGDRADWCRYLRDSSCYTYEKHCCERCRPRGPTGCEYGNKNLYCGNADCSDPYYRDKCCSTCGTFANTPRDCADEGDWCRRRKPWECYDASIRRSCCRTCALRKIGPPGCEYGDKVGWCSSRWCARERTRCCGTCS